MQLSDIMFCVCIGVCRMCTCVRMCALAVLVTLIKYPIMSVDAFKQYDLNTPVLSYLLILSPKFCHGSLVSVFYPHNYFFFRNLSGRISVNAVYPLPYFLPLHVKRKKNACKTRYNQFFFSVIPPTNLPFSFFFPFNYFP